MLRTTAGGPACPRCRASLAPTGDAGMALDKLDSPVAITPPCADAWKLETDAYELRRIGRKLRRTVRIDAPSTPHRVEAPVVEPPRPASAAEPPYSPPSETAARPRRREWSDSVASVVTDSGLLTAVAGAVIMLMQDKGYLIADFWRWGALGAGISAAVFAFGVRRLAMQASRRGSELESEIVELRKRVERLTAANARRGHDSHDGHEFLGPEALTPETPSSRYGRVALGLGVSSRAR